MKPYFSAVILSALLYVLSCSWCFFYPVGIRIASVLPDGAAASAGILIDDEIISVDNRDLTSVTLETAKLYVSQASAKVCHLRSCQIDT